MQRKRPKLLKRRASRQQVNKPDWERQGNNARVSFFNEEDRQEI